MLDCVPTSVVHAIATHLADSDLRACTLAHPALTDHVFSERTCYDGWMLGPVRFRGNIARKLAALRLRMPRLREVHVHVDADSRFRARTWRQMRSAADAVTVVLHVHEPNEDLHEMLFRWPIQGVFVRRLAVSAASMEKMNLLARGGYLVQSLELHFDQQRLPPPSTRFDIASLVERRRAFSLLRRVALVGIRDADIAPTNGDVVRALAGVPEFVVSCGFGFGFGVTPLSLLDICTHLEEHESVCDGGAGLPPLPSVRSMVSRRLVSLCVASPHMCADLLRNQALFLGQPSPLAPNLVVRVAHHALFDPHVAVFCDMYLSTGPPGRRVELCVWMRREHDPSVAATVACSWLFRSVLAHHGDVRVATVTIRRGREVAVDGLDAGDGVTQESALAALLQYADEGGVGRGVHDVWFAFLCSRRAAM